ncbi:hypothetical protein GALMADRAFT_210684 [Galerina marginata CBS 339.88]|uniref:Uncharacterized protein n=1 Tax=Galerina marginata (strain CBS 339.88) TaxID=685588 RepID=A0A067T3C9_GALM3|nr:hypothetical protein GALMADRAFT_210684 [Galerina marginata CBS 339.88]
MPIRLHCRGWVLAAVAGAISTARLRATEEPRVEVMFIILVVSLFGLSLRIRIAALPPAHEHRHKPHLTGNSGRWHRLLDADTVGVVCAYDTGWAGAGNAHAEGLSSCRLVVGVADGGESCLLSASTLFTQAIMSSISAGLLIYSATDDNEDNLAAHDDGQTHEHVHELTGSTSISGLQSITGGEATQTRASSSSGTEKSFVNGQSYRLGFGMEALCIPISIPNDGCNLQGCLEARQDFGSRDTTPDTTPFFVRSLCSCGGWVYLEMLVGPVI